MEDTVVTRAQLVAVGRDRGTGDRRVRDGTWVRVAPSTWLTAAPSLVQAAEAALHHVGGHGVVTGLSGCRLLGLPYVPGTSSVADRTDPPATSPSLLPTAGLGGVGAPTLVEVLVGPRRNLVSTPWVRVLPTTRPPAWRLVQGIPVASVQRCLIDAGRRLTRLQDVRALLLGALAAGRVTLAQLQAELDAGARNGSALCRRALADARRGAASAPEAELADIAIARVRRGQLPRLLLNPEVRCDGRFVGRPDWWCVGLGLGGEVDSVEHHGAGEAFERTLERHDGFTSYGLQLLHVTPKRLRRLGDAYGQVLVDAVRTRRASGYAEPAGLVVTPRGPLLPEGGRRGRA